MTVSTRLDEITPEGPGAVPVKPDRLIGEVRAADHAAVLFCGRETSEFIGGVGSRDARRLIDEARGDGRVRGAICMGQNILLKFDVLSGRSVARSPHVTASYEQAGAKPVAQAVVTDRGVVTAARPQDAEPFADAVLTAIGK